MKTMVQFEVSGSAYCLPVESTRAVRSSVGMVALPAPRPNVAGLLPGDPPLTVMQPLGPGGHQIIVMQVGRCAVRPPGRGGDGIARIDETTIREAPRGQDQELVSGSIDIDGRLVLLTDPLAVAVGI